MTIRQAAIFFFAVTGVFTAVFVGLTIHSHTRFPALTNADQITDEVLAGKDVWHHNNCVNCHTLMGEGAYFAPDLTRITQHRGAAYLTSFLQEPGRFYSEEVHGRVMRNPGLDEAEISSVIAFLDWIAAIDNFDWPPRPIVVTGGIPGSYGPGPAREAASDDPVAQGEALFRTSPPACFTCHSTSAGVVLAGPSLAGMATRAEAVVASEKYTGSATTAEGYVLESIIEPHAHITQGPEFFATNGRSIMPDNYDRTLTTEQIEHLVEYLMSLR
jgi:nitric oxide reductase subunit C